MGFSMKNILKAVMLSRLKKTFPKITDISRETGTNHLYIRCQGLEYIRKLKQNDEEVKAPAVFKIVYVNPNDRKEPYTEETLEKVLREFPDLFSNEIARIKQSRGFISFSTYTIALTREELEKDIEHVFNYSVYNLENDPVRNVSMIKTLNNSPLLPGSSKSKRKKERE